MITLACATGIHTKLPLSETLDRIKALGFSYVDIFAFENWAHVNPSEIEKDSAGEGARVKQMLDERALSCVALNGGFYAKRGTITRSDEEHAANQITLAAMCDFANILGAKIITIGAGTIDPELGLEGTIAHAASRLSDLAEVTASKGITLGIETHFGQFVENPDLAHALIQASTGVSITYDPSHFIAAEYPIETSLKLLPMTKHVHLRNARPGSYQETMEKGLLDASWMIDQIVESGYDGVVALEYIEDNAVKEGYDVEAETIILRDLMLEKMKNAG